MDVVVAQNAYFKQKGTTMKSIILTHSMYQDQEVIYPYHRLREEGQVIIVAEQRGKIRGILGTEIMAEAMTADLLLTSAPTMTFTERALINFDLLLLPGGVKAMEKLRQDANALMFIVGWWDTGKPIASMCSGAQMLISARVPLKGWRLAAYPAMAVDVENAGATFISDPVVVDGKLVSSPHYNWLAEWVRMAITLVNR